MDYEFTFLLPCLNEEKTVEFCIKEIKKAINEYNLDAEILISDNGSTDNTKMVALNNGARVVVTPKKGYGSALINGTKNAKGKFCIMGDADGSYDFYNIKEFIDGIKSGYDLVVGNRFLGGIEHNAMPFSHKIGVKFLSAFANMFFHTPIHDFHCGLRVFNTEKISKLNLKQEGMEYASEMIIEAKKHNLKIIEVPTILRKDKRDSKSHLRTIRDGIRHMILILKLSCKRRSK